MGANENRVSHPLGNRTTIGRAPICPDRVRNIGGQGFAFIPNRFLQAGFFSSLTPDELRLYLLLVLAGDRSGLSFYHYDSLCSLLEVTLDAYVEARNGLVHADLVAYDGTRFQVLSLPVTPKLSAAHAVEDSDAPEAQRSTEIRDMILASLAHV